MKIKIKKWFIFTEYGVNAVPYILDFSNEEVNSNEIALCVYEQIYKKQKEKNK